MKGYVQDGGGPKDSENTLSSFLTKTNRTVFWQIGTDMLLQALFLDISQKTQGEKLNLKKK